MSDSTGSDQITLSKNVTPTDIDDLHRFVTRIEALNAENLLIPVEFLRRMEVFLTSQRNLYSMFRSKGGT